MKYIRKNKQPNRLDNNTVKRLSEYLVYGKAKNNP